MDALPSARDIQRWYPKRWSEIAGNGKMVNTWLSFLINGICNVLFTGPSRTGKTRTICLGIKALLCTSRTAELNPCGECLTCKNFGDGRHAHTGLFQRICRSEFEFYPVDCETVSREELLNLRDHIDLESKSSVIHLDEVAALGRRGLEGYLLKTIDESQATWIASAITVRRRTKKGSVRHTECLSIPMQGRFGVKVGSSAPSDPELDAWIRERCREWRIDIVDPDNTIPMIIARTVNRVGYILHLLADAAARGRRIDPDHVRNFNFGPED